MAKGVYVNSGVGIRHFLFSRPLGGSKPNQVESQPPGTVEAAQYFLAGVRDSTR